LPGYRLFGVNAFHKEMPLTPAEVHAHVGRAVVDSKKYRNAVHRRSLLMIIELGTLTETTQDDGPHAGIDQTGYREPL
jgi:hypothetical protein